MNQWLDRNVRTRLTIRAADRFASSVGIIRWRQITRRDGALSENAPARLAVGDRNGARRNRDGSLDVVVSSTRSRTGNWLPAPRADMQLVLRLYAPKPQATDGSWQPPAVVRQ